MPNRPITATRKSNPLSSAVEPNVRRRAPVTGSVPAAAEEGAPVDARQQDDRRGGAAGRLRHREGERQQDRDAVCATQPGQHADDDPQHDTDEHQRQVLQAQRDDEALDERLDFVHQSRPSSASTGPFGRGTLNQISKMRKNATLLPMLTAATFHHGYLPSRRMKNATYTAEAT